MAEIYWIQDGKVCCGDETNRPSDCPLTCPCPGEGYEFDGAQWVLPKDYYKTQRTRAYPHIGDQLDAILKYLQTKTDLSADLLGIIEEWQQVKKDYPKP